MPTKEDGAQFPYGLAVGPNGPMLSPGAVLDTFLGTSRAGGIETVHRNLVTSSQTLASQGMRITFFTAPYSFTSIGAEYGTGTSAAGATPTLIRYGLYSVSPSTQNMTLIASTTNDTALFAGTNTRYPKNWDTPVQLVAGQRYAVALLVVTAAASANHPSTTARVGNLQNLLPLTGASFNSQADLPATIANSGLSNVSTDIYAFIY